MTQTVTGAATVPITMTATGIATAAANLSLMALTVIVGAPEFQRTQAVELGRSRGLSRAVLWYAAVCCGMLWYAKSMLKYVKVC